MTQQDPSKKVYRWETGYEKTWSAITSYIDEEEDEKPIEKFLEEYEIACKRRKLVLSDENSAANQINLQNLNMLRHLFVVFDVSKSALKQDYKPTRITALIHELANFVTNFYENNPLSSLGFITTKDKKAVIQAPLSDNINNCKKVLKEISSSVKLDADNFCTGEPSLQASLLKASSYLANLPDYFSKEILVIMSSLRIRYFFTSKV